MRDVVRACKRLLKHTHHVRPCFVEWRCRRRQWRRRQAKRVAIMYKSTNAHKTSQTRENMMMWLCVFVWMCVRWRLSAGSPPSASLCACLAGESACACVLCYPPLPPEPKCWLFNVFINITLRHATRWRLLSIVASVRRRRRRPGLFVLIHPHILSLHRFAGATDVLMCVGTLQINASNWRGNIRTDADERSVRRVDVLV